MRTEESKLQKAIVANFRTIYPRHARRLFAIPNGGHRNIATAARLKAEGVMRGVPDLFLSVPRNGMGGLFIEVKTAKGRLTPEQVQFVNEHRDAYAFAVVRSVPEFFKAVAEYLTISKTENKSKHDTGN